MKGYAVFLLLLPILAVSDTARITDSLLHSWLLFSLKLRL